MTQPAYDESLSENDKTLLRQDDSIEFIAYISRGTGEKNQNDVRYILNQQ